MFGLSKRESLLNALLLVLGMMATGWGVDHLINKSGDEIVKATTLVSAGQAASP